MKAEPVKFPELPHWTFTVIKRSASSIEMVASREAGRSSFVATGPHYEELLDAARAQATLMDAPPSHFREYRVVNFTRPDAPV